MSLWKQGGRTSGMMLAALIPNWPFINLLKFAHYLSWHVTV